MKQQFTNRLWVFLCLFGTFLFFGRGSINAQISASYNWNSGGLVWTSDDFEVDTDSPCEGAGSAIVNYFYGYSFDAVSPALSGNNGGILTVNFQYKITEYADPGTEGSLTYLGTVKLQWATSATGPWTDIYTIDNTNHVESTSCATINATANGLPATGDIYLRFLAIADEDADYDLYIDDVQVSQSAPPSCFAVSGLSLSVLQADAATVTWNPSSSSPANGYVYYYNTTNTVPAAPSGTATGTTANLSSLTTSTTYYFWAAAVCGAGDTSTLTGPITFVTPCAATNIPYLEDFESASLPAIPTCTSVENVGQGNVWTTAALSGFSNVMTYVYNSSYAANTWFYTQGINLTAGTVYRISYKYANNSTAYVEKFKVAYGQAPVATAMTTPLADHPNVTGAVLSSNDVDFTPSTSGVYYFGFNAYSGINQYELYVDDISVDLAPSCVAPTNLVTSGITANEATVKWNQSLSLPADGYVYYYNTTNTAPSVPNGATAAGDTTADLSSLTENTMYYVWAAAVCGSGDTSNLAGPISFTTPCIATNIPYYQDFETATTPDLPSCTSRENLGQGNNWNTTNTTSYGFSSNVLRYSYNSNYAANAWFYTQGVNLTSGTSYRIKYKYATSSTSSVEKLKIAYGTAASAASMTTILADHPSISNNVAVENYLDFVPSASGVYYFGFNVYSAADQYTLYVDDISVELSPSCVNPLNLAVSGVTTNEATVKWNQSLSLPADGYVYYYNTTNTAPTAPSGTTAAGDTTIDLSSLTANTMYYVWAAAVCGAGDTSALTGPMSFTTLCDAITALPWTENFDGVAANATYTQGRVPDCWLGVDKVSVMSDASSYIIPSSPSNALAFQYATSSTTGAWAFTPQFELQAGTSYRFKFSYRNYNTSAFDTLRIGLGINASVGAMTIIGTPLYDITNTTYSEYYVDFTVPSTGNYNLGINVWEVSTSPWYLLVDDVSLDLTPTCEVPTNIVVSGITTDNATITWQQSSSLPADGYVYYYNTSNTAPGSSYSGTTAAGDTTTDLSSLTANTTYYVWVKAACASSDSSTWTGPVSFTTLCNATNIPYYLDFESVTTPAIPGCTSIENAGTGNNWRTASNPGYGFTGQVLNYPYNSSNPANAWFYTQGLNLTAGTSYRLRFRYGNNSSSYTESLKVAYGTSVSNTSMTTVLADFPSISLEGSNLYFIDFIPASSGVYYIGFNAYSSTNQYQLYVDDISVELTPSCSEPMNLTATATSQNSATVEWGQSVSSPSLGYEYYYSTSNTAPTASTVASGSTAAGDTTADLTGLTASSTYYIWVRSVCSSSDTSVWSPLTSVYTGYCIPESDYGDTYFDSVYTIGGVTNITNNGSGYANGGYADYYNSDSLTIMVGDTAYMTFYLASYSGAGVSIYVDFDNNLTFDPSEQLYSSGTYLGDELVTLQIALPASIAPGTYRARIISDDMTDDPYACEILEDWWFGGRYGEAEDYKIVVIPACTPPVVNLGADSSVCAGTSVTLNAGNPGSTYLWSTGAVTQTISVNAQGSYWVKVTDGVCSTSDTVTITVKPLPTVSVTASALTVCPDKPVTLTASGADSYAWSDGGTGATHVVTPSATTTYTVTGTTNGCSGDATVSIIVQDCVGLEDVASYSVKLYPNPASSSVTIAGEALTAHFTSYTVVDLTGKVVLEASVTTDETSIDVHSLVDGIYFVNLHGSQTKTFKVEIRH